MVRAGARILEHLLVEAICLLLGLWHWCSWRAFGNRCRFYPSCSVYFQQSLRGYGLLLGGWMGIRRVLRCHPWNPGGFDPIPEPKRQRDS